MEDLSDIAREKVLRRKVTCPRCKKKTNVDVILMLDKKEEEVFEVRFRHDREKVLKLW
jgi:transcription elongation factor Elf1